MNQTLAAAGLRSRPEAYDVAAVTHVLRATGFFSAAEVVIGAELVQECLRLGDASGYHFLFRDAAPAGEDAARGTPADGLIGYCCFGEIPLTVGSFDLYWIAVDPARQSRGCGSSLLHAAEAEIVALGGRRIFVDTSGRPQYEPTRRFYEARGYQAVARLSDFYGAEDDKVVYGKRLG